MSQLGFHFTRAGNRQRVFMHLLLYSEGFVFYFPSRQSEQVHVKAMQSDLCAQALLSICIGCYSKDVGVCI